MGLSTAERNRRKRERKKREREERRKQESKNETYEEEENPAADVEIEYVVAAAEQPREDDDSHNNNMQMESILRRFQQRAAVVVVTDDDDENNRGSNEEAATAGAAKQGDDDDESNMQQQQLSRRKLRELSRPTVAELKTRVQRPDLVEAHDVTAPDPDFLIYLKAVPGTVPVPRHWGRKRKYLQGKRGFEKPPFQLPDFIIKTGITDVRDTLAEDESKMSAKQKNRGRVAPKMGAMDVDYRTLHDAFFKHQTKPTHMTAFGDLYYEGKELETKMDLKPGGPLSQGLREALGMTSENAPPPWLINMQRYGPPPSYPNLKIPGLNAPLPSEQCQYGYHTGGWGKPPVDTYGRPLYGGNPFAKPGVDESDAARAGGLVTSDGKTIAKNPWGALPTGMEEGEESEEESEEEEESSEEEEMEESEGEEVEAATDGTESVLPPPPTVAPSAVEMRKQAGDETPFDAGPKQLYTILEQKKAEDQAGAVFSSEVAYKLPGAATVPEGAESVLSKAMAPSGDGKKKRKHDEDEDTEHIDKSFKF